MTERTSKSYEDQIAKLIAYVHELEAEIAELKEAMERKGTLISEITISADSAVGMILAKFEWMEKRVAELEAQLKAQGETQHATAITE